MTWFGKGLVFFNLVLSLVLGTWAMTLYTSRIDWSDQKGKDGQPDGELVRRIAQAQEGWSRIPSAAANWEEARAILLAMENGAAKLKLNGKESKVNGRQANREWYQAELEFLRSKATAMQPCQALVLDDQRRLTFNDPDPLTPRPKMLPVMDRAGKPLRSLASYNEEEKTLFASLKKEQERLEAATKEDTRLTLLLIGDKALGTKGLHRRLIDERVKREDIMVEHGLVKTPLINTYVESELLLKRKRSLEVRLDELRRARAARIAALGGQ